MKIDLHLHSYVSDGALSPEALVDSAAAIGLDVISLTDHDTASGVERALAAAARYPLTVIPGIEISTTCGPHDLHVLGYWIDPRAAAIQTHQLEASARRIDRMRRMVERLNEMGIAVTLEEVQRTAGPEVYSLGRPHLAATLVANGAVRSYNEAFMRFISDAGPAFVSENFPTPAEAISTIHASGGIAVWAHPPAGIVEELLPELVDWGLDGIECYRPRLQSGEIERFVGLGRAYGLLVTGGSDWHGPRPNFELGEFNLGYHQVADFLSHGGIRAV